jgi:hypothetical protein
MHANEIKEVTEFVIESNLIEGIYGVPTQEEILCFIRFKALEKITVDELITFVSIVQPGASLREKIGMNVRVGSYYPPKGGPEMRGKLQDILDASAFVNAFNLHIMYEQLHPFTDGNGRSGRALWAWKNKSIRGGFLKNWYFQTLQNS